MTPTPELVEDLRAFFLRHRDELVLPQFKDLKRKGCPLCGLCYITAETYYHLEGKTRGFHPMQATINGISHWWLETGEGEVFDMVLRKRPEGRPTAFMTQEPSKRCRRATAMFLAEQQSRRVA